MKKTGKILLILMIIAALLVGTTVTAFADESSESDRQSNDRALTRLFEQYDPDDLDVYQQLKEEHRAFHEERRDVLEEMRQQMRAAYTNLLEALLDEEISIEEARDIYESLQEKSNGFKDEAGEVLDAKKAENEEIRGQLEDLRSQIRAALDEDEVDAELMESLLQQTLALLQQHLELDLSTAEQIDDIWGKYFSE